MSDETRGETGGRSHTRDPEFERRTAEEYVAAINEWMAPLQGRFYSVSFLLMFMQLMSNPGMTRSKLAHFLETNVNVSRSTAERLITDAKAEGHLIFKNPPEKRGFELYVSEELRSHFYEIFLKAADSRSRDRIRWLEEAQARRRKATGDPGTDPGGRAPGAAPGPLGRG
jgi:hypothetical protein